LVSHPLQILWDLSPVLPIVVTRRLGPATAVWRPVNSYNYESLFTSKW